MKRKELDAILKAHMEWLAGKGGAKANLSGANLSGANLSGANLSGANLSGADLRGADLSGAYLNEANLSGANLRGADLSGAYLNEADLSWANLSGANLSGADLSWANLSGANLSGAGLLVAADWLTDNFEADDHGILVYKVFGLHYTPSSTWEIEPGYAITETCHPDPCLPCACGINFGTKDWIVSNVRGQQVWKARIAWIDLADAVVPYNTDGKARCGRLTLLEDVTEDFKT